MVHTEMLIVVAVIFFTLLLIEIASPTTVDIVSLFSDLVINYSGERVDLDNFFIGCVDVRDVAHYLITLYENPSAQGHHLCIESITRLIDFTDKVANIYPEFPVQRVQEDKQEWVMRAKDPAKRLIDLGVRFTPIDKTIKDTVDYFRSKALI
ncbi:hypothetical protein PR202_ga09193 [Eleusine coracana subsp. coracana]|uniref:Uncharacterized protein n=1 Tax=Eleusine coracana subsp. coracana TaxID=191504 RepID=A0AAV5C2C2_ELECO|nr:hypothetical protein PR202_ga09193 [Eleusine coracana subsp. coracana]